MRPLSELLLDHDELDRLFLCHQEALLSRDVAEAAKWLDRFSRLLSVHMQREENCLLPAFEALALEIPGGGPELFRAEHRKLGKLLDELHKRLEQLADVPDLNARTVIELLDSEFTFKHLLQHHDSRERKVLYPVLDQHLDDARKLELWRAMEAQASE